MECFGAGGGFSVGPATCLFAIKAAEQMVADGRRWSQTAEPAEPAKPAKPSELSEPAEPAGLFRRGWVAMPGAASEPTVVFVDSPE